MSDSTDQLNDNTNAAPEAPAPPPRTTTTLGRSWLLKTMLFLVLLLGFGGWGLADALYFYPRRGGMDASIKFARHLQAAQSDGSLTPSRLKCPEPRAELERLRAKRDDIEQRTANPATQKTAHFEKTRLIWLESLALMWQVNTKPKFLEKEPGPPPRKLYFNMLDGDGDALAADGTKTKLSSLELLGKLAPKLNTTANVTPLSGLDMLFQWVFVVVGFGGGLYVLFTLFRAMSKQYKWDPETQRLTFPDKSSFVPADLAEIDKRLWHKFFVTMHLKAGGSKKLDLLRYVPLEDWVLAMEKTAFPEAVAEEERKKAEEQNQAQPAPND